MCLLGLFFVWAKNTAVAQKKLLANLIPSPWFPVKRGTRCTALILLQGRVNIHHIKLTFKLIKIKQMKVTIKVPEYKDRAQSTVLEVGITFFPVIIILLQHFRKKQDNLKGSRKLDRFPLPSRKVGFTGLLGHKLLYMSVESTLKIKVKKLASASTILWLGINGEGIVFIENSLLFKCKSRC